MESILASQNLAIVSYKVATEPDYLENLARQIETGKIDGGNTLTDEEASAIRRFLDQRKYNSQDVIDPDVLASTWIA